MSKSMMQQKSTSPLLTIAAVAGLALSILLVQRVAFAAEPAVQIAPPALDEPATPGQATAVFAGGCFWGVQGVFQHVRGVQNAVSGYAGGAASTAHYEQVGGGDTGHAEAVQITYDPSQVSYGKLLQVFFSVAHDPTQLDRQGPDSGTQYRSAIFPVNAEQEKVAQAYIEQLDGAKVFASKIVTRIEDHKVFYPAEGYHQNYLRLHPYAPYIALNDLPKVENLKRMEPQLYRADPVLVPNMQ
ncbi:peptide-methionine (S)-S-oxide reductase MsrA [Pseudomonas asplenii]|uniref:peptide-methionine (S)-S-oxide reductase MsrA n=1 Tax=Pseudomonas asplenii TaxID=53407 RepID=UPI002234DD19|nr:peptide-methionine (S)-S-oxide reductase MsrA [Pseudomonas asplenii]UZE31733.1 peptide-methionine (S)-S-oxide reductase MsrA [Pseudomonas asplenii]